MRLIVFIAIFFFISACSTLPHQQQNNQSQQDPIWLKHKSEIDNINHWQISGRFGATSEEESWNGSINWLQDTDQYNINISGPLSSGSISLSGNAHRSKLQLGGDKVFEAEDPETLLETYTNLRLPVKNLRYWLLGLPSPLNQNSYIKLNSKGQLSHLSQMGWDISFRKYAKIDNIYLPDKIFLENHEFDVRLVIQKWQIQS